MPTALQDRLRFQELADGTPMSATVFDPLIRDAMLRHPAEPYLPLIGAVRAWRVRDADPIPYLQRVLTRAKRYGRAHLLLADILFARRAKTQALLELKLAVRDEPGLVHAAVAAAVKHTQDHSDLLRIVPNGMEGAPVLDTLGAWMTARDADVGKKLDEQALALDPARLGPLQRRAGAIVAELVKGDKSTPCAQDKRRACANAIEKYALAIASASPETSHAAQLRARALLALDQPDRARQVLGGVCERVTDRVPCVKAQVEVAARLKDQAQVDALLEQIAALGCSAGKPCAGTYLWIGDFSWSQGNRGGAANAFHRATRHDPQNAEAWRRLGEASAALGSHARAVQAFERVMQLAPSDAVKAQLEDQRRKMVGSLVRQ
jgi:tetratricopeptide (TPR) repeat protein